METNILSYLTFQFANKSQIPNLFKLLDKMLLDSLLKEVKKIRAIHMDEGTK